MSTTNSKMSTDDLDASLPWYAAGTLDPREAAQVEAALAADGELAFRLDLVREEMTETILLNEALGVPSARMMDNLFKAIDRERKAGRAPVVRSGLGAWLADMLTPRHFAFAGAAAMAVILLQAGVIAKLLQNRTESGASYETASDFSAGTRGFEMGSYVLVRFSPQASMAEITRFLDDQGVAIVDGPRPGGSIGLYRVRIARTALAKSDLDRRIQEFQGAGDVVTFAVPTE
jgi:hypothetical protein